MSREHLLEGDTILAATFCNRCRESHKGVAKTPGPVAPGWSAVQVIRQSYEGDTLSTFSDLCPACSDIIENQLGESA